jgi:RNA polymerase sigma factor (sigma-70 family)
VFFAFGDGPTKFLTHEEAIAASPNERLQSVWPFLVDSVIRFELTLRPRERANFDAEDVLTELVVKLLEKDSKWEPERGRYITFVARVIANEFIKLRDRTRTVRSPGNSYSRLKEYEAEEALDAISPERLATLGALRRALCSTDTLEGFEPVAREILGPDEETERREDLACANDAIVKAILGLTKTEVTFLSRAYGLWGQQEKTMNQIADTYGYTRAAIKALQARTRQKMRDRLEQIRHPACNEPTTLEDEGNL